MTETVVHLKPASAWRPGMTREKLIGELDAAVTMPGVANIWTQPIINRINMLTTGIRSEVGVKLFGHDLTALEERARAVAGGAAAYPWRGDVYPEQVTGAPYLDIRVNREAAARYGITVGAIQDVIETAVGETNLDADHRRAPALSRARALCPAVSRQSRGAGESPRAGAQRHARCPWGRWPPSHTVSGPAMIASENGLLVVTVLLNVRGRDVGSFVEEARQSRRGDGQAAAGVLHRMERAVRERDPRAPALADRHPGRAGRDLPPAVCDVSLAPGGGARAAGGALCALGGHLSPLRPGLQHVGGGHGWALSRCLARRCKPPSSW